MGIPTIDAALAAIRTKPAVPLSTASVALRIASSTASAAVARDDFPVPFVRMGARVIVPTPALRTLLQLPSDPLPA